MQKIFNSLMVLILILTFVSCKAQSYDKLYSKKEFDKTSFKMKYAEIITTDYDTLYLTNNKHRIRQIYGHKISGIYNEFVDDILRFTVFVSNGKFHGNFEVYHNGSNKIKSEGYYFNGIMIEMKEYDLEGNILHTYKSKNYIDGIKIE